MRKTMKKLFTLVAIAGLAFSTIGCAEKKAAAPPADPAVKTDDAAAPPPVEPAPEEKK